MIRFMIVAIMLIAITPRAEADINETLQNICNIVKANDKGEMRKKIGRVQKDYSLKLREYYTGISCGGASLVQYADDNGSYDVLEFIIKKLPKRTLEPFNYSAKLSAEGVSILLSRMN